MGDCKFDHIKQKGLQEEADEKEQEEQEEKRANMKAETDGAVVFGRLSAESLRRHDEASVPLRTGDHPDSPISVCSSFSAPSSPDFFQKDDGVSPEVIVI